MSIKRGLVLEGGAMRGMYTAGVLDVLMDNDIKFDCIFGVSAGAVFGVNYLSHQRGRVIRYNKRFNRDKRYMGIIPLIKNGNFINTEYAYDKVPKILDKFDDETFKKSDVPFFAAVTDIETGKCEYIRIKSVFDQMDVLRASASLPFISKPVKIGDRLYLDGGITDSIPFRKAIEWGLDKTVVITTREPDYVKKPMRGHLAEIFYKKKYPMFCESLKNRYKVYNQSREELKKLEEENKVFVISPDRPIGLKRTERDPEKLQKAYDMGEKDALKSLKEMIEYLEV